MQYSVVRTAECLLAYVKEIDPEIPILKVEIVKLWSKSPQSA